MKQHNTHEEELHKDVASLLHTMKKVSAPDFFEADLMRKINAEEYKEKKGFLSRLFSPVGIAGWVSFASVILLVVVFNPFRQGVTSPEEMVESIQQSGSEFVVYTPITSKEQSVTNLATSSPASAEKQVAKPAQQVAPSSALPQNRDNMIMSAPAKREPQKPDSSLKNADADPKIF